MTDNTTSREKTNANMKKPIITILTAAAIGILLTAAEFAAHRSGMEFRTYAQVIKGTYLWLVMPQLILFSANTLLRKLIERHSESVESAEPMNIGNISNGIRKIFVALFAVAVYLTALFRGAMYVLSDEIVTEKLLPDGYMEGSRAGFLSETHYSYYEPVGVFFRKPMNWTAEQLTAKVKEKYSPDAELVERQDDGWYVFRIPDVLAAGEYIYFHVSDSYDMRSNAYFQILLSEASHFWNSEHREVTLAKGERLESAVDTGEKWERPFLTEKLYISCNGSQLDITACAADITDWLQFVKSTGQLPYEEDPNASRLLSSMCIECGRSYGDCYYAFDLYPLDDYIGDDSWGMKYDRMLFALTQAFDKHLARHESEQNNSSTDESAENSFDIEERDALFMSAYSGDYEKECPIGDGTIRYRMVVRDAALGSRLYSLLKSTDSGNTWQMSSSMPFGEDWGMGIDFTFLSEDFGFAALMHNGGDEADLYVTENGGDSYQLVTMEAYTVSLDNGYTYSPYDYPQMPYEKDGVIYVLCGQGADGDYAGGDTAGLALYKSADGGHTFTFVEIQPSENDG